MKIYMQFFIQMRVSTVQKKLLILEYMLSEVHKNHAEYEAERVITDLFLSLEKTFY